jgi:hypothetical protein
MPQRLVTHALMCGEAMPMLRGRNADAVHGKGVFEIFPVE